MNAAVHPGMLRGCAAAPPSKSAAHRALICAALAGEGRVSPVSHSDDMAATLEVLNGLGFPSSREGDAIRFAPPVPVREPLCPCRESGSTLRFLLPVAAALGLGAHFTGEGRLPERPLEPLLSLMKSHGAAFTSDTLPFTLSGKLRPGCFSLPGNVSSQFISGLLFALPLLEGDSQIIVTSPLQSAGYVDLTLRALAASGITVTPVPGGYAVPGKQRYLPRTRAVEGDWSGAAFWLCAGALFGEIRVTGLDPDSAQGDRAIVDILREMGADAAVTPAAVSIAKAPLRGTRIDAAPIPDLVPILAVTAAFAQGDTEIYNAARLRIKESDRLASAAALLHALGAQADEYPDRLVIHGGKPLHGGFVEGANDHRIVMSAAVAALGCDGPVEISTARAVEKSYPDFFRVMKTLGGVCDVL